MGFSGRKLTQGTSVNVDNLIVSSMVDQANA